MEQTLLQCEGFEGHEAAVKEVCARRRPTLHTQHTSLNALPSPSQGLKLWMLKVQRAGDRAFDRFEKETGETVFHVPSDLQQGAAAAWWTSAVDAEVARSSRSCTSRRSAEGCSASSPRRRSRARGRPSGERRARRPAGARRAHRALTSSAQLDAALRAAQQFVGGAADGRRAAPAARAQLGGAEQQHASARADRDGERPDLAQPPPSSALAERRSFPRDGTRCVCHAATMETGEKLRGEKRRTQISIAPPRVLMRRGAHGGRR